LYVYTIHQIYGYSTKKVSDFFFSFLLVKRFPIIWGKRVSTSDKYNSGDFFGKKVSDLFREKSSDILFEKKFRIFSGKKFAIFFREKKFQYFILKKFYIFYEKKFLYFFGNFFRFLSEKKFPNFS
jgi:hypothetical protein